jgi:hypothetical protein
VVGRNNDLPSSPFWSNTDIANLGGQHIFNWWDNIGSLGVQPWLTIEDGFTNNPGTDTIWYVPLWGGADSDIHGCFGPRDRDAVADVYDELHARATAHTETISVVISAAPLFSPLTLSDVSCYNAHSQYQKSVDAVAWALANSKADSAGPVLTPITDLTNNGPTDPCHCGVGQGPGFLNVSDHPTILQTFGW